MSVPKKHVVDRLPKVSTVVVRLPGGGLATYFYADMTIASVFPKARAKVKSR